MIMNTIYLRPLRVMCIITTLSLIWGANPSQANHNQCGQYFNNNESLVEKHPTIDKVIEVMERNPYDPFDLPTIPPRMFKWIGNRLSFFVGRRSLEILRDTRDYREEGMDKPIHAMGVGLVGELHMIKTRWSGIFRGGTFPVVARASISQPNPLKYDHKGRAQVRSTAMAIKIFDPNGNSHVPTANALFQNDLNGLLDNNGQPLNYLESEQTNEPDLDITKIRKAYEILTLIGVAYGSIMNPLERVNKVPFINPQIRPVHSLAEMNEQHAQDIKTPTWVMIVPKLQRPPVEESDFRLEIANTLARDGYLEFELFASDQQTQDGSKIWEPVGLLVFTRSILSAGVDKNLLFFHDSLNSSMTGQTFKIPNPIEEVEIIPIDAPH
jgi:hypothetical protein